MALLQISEPGQTPDPHQRRVAVGIDLGTTHSLVAAVRSGVAECLPDENGRVILPSVVRYLADNGRKIGYEALAASAQDPQNTISSVKRFMGRGLNDIVRRDKLPYSFVEQQGMISLQTVAGAKSPVEVSAEILATLRYRAEDTFNSDLYGAVITVPAYFDDAQRQATKDAAQLAGINVLRLINEPTAAAIAYGLDNASEGIYAIYDLGGGTFDISILRLSKGVFEVLSTGGDSALGGDDYDRALADWVMAQAGVQVRTPQDKAIAIIAARACKEELSAAHCAACHACIGGENVRFDVVKEQFEKLTAELTARTMTAVRKALRDAQLSKDEIKGVVMVGGSTRMPQIQRAVAEFFGREPLTNLNPDEVVAIGAAVQAGILQGDVKDILLLDVTPLTLSIETFGSVATPMIPKNTTVPTAKSQIFSTAADNQTSVEVHVLQGERPMAGDNKTLAKFILDGIPPSPRGIPQVEVTFDIDANGILEVKAKDRATSKEQQVRITGSSMLDKKDVDSMVRDAEMHAAEDAKHREEVDLRNQTEALSFQAERTLTDLGDKVSPEDRAAVEAKLNDVRDALKGDDIGSVRARGTELAELMQRIATAAYAASEPGAGKGSGDAPDGSGGAASGSDEETVEGEFTEV